MATLAIEGHKTRGKEVIEILEMLGGDNKYHINTTECNLLYTIREGDDVIIGTYPNSSISQIYTLEEFLEKFPYKVGDKVQHKGATSCGSIFEIEKMRWEEDTIKYTLRLFGCNYKTCTLPAEYLQPYKEETMDKANKAVFDANAQCCDITNHLIKEETMEENNEKSANHVFDTEVITFDIAQRDKYELDLQGKFQVVLREGKYYVERIKPKYPKTYEECCKVLNTYCTIPSRPGYKEALIAIFQELLICRDAYWKIAGDWKFNFDKPCYYLCNEYGSIQKFQGPVSYNVILAFPTKEMRDAFYENFKDLIEQCKKLL